MNWQGERHRLDTLQKAEDFDKYFMTEDLTLDQEDENKQKTQRTPRTEEQLSGEQELDYQEETENTNQDIILGAKRKTRATNPIYGAKIWDIFDQC